MAEDNASILKKENRWQLRNDVVDMSMVFAKGSIDLTSFRNIKAAVNYVEPDNKGHLFSHVCNDSLVRADDGGWVLEGDENHKLTYIQAWDGNHAVRVATDPLAVQLILFPSEEVEYFSVNLGVFSGDSIDGRVAVSGHFRQRFKYHDPSHFLSTNDWDWPEKERTNDATYRSTAIPRAASAGFDRMHFDDYWYWPADSCQPKNDWTDMPSLCELIVSNGMKPGHWFSLQGKYCGDAWANGRDCADPANVAFKIKQCEEILIGQYKSAWDQLDAGLLWKNAEPNAYSHPSDSVYRKILGMRKYMNSITHKYPDFIMQATCEIDNPAKKQNVGIAHLCDNGMAGMFVRTDNEDHVRDLFDSIGLFPLEGLAATYEVRHRQWQDSPNWYYQLLLARHASFYVWPGHWSPERITRLRTFNDWRRNPRIKAALAEMVRPVYNGKDWQRNDGPWAWTCVNEQKSGAILLALHHQKTGYVKPIRPSLRWLDDNKTYLIEDITMGTNGFTYAFMGAHPGAALKSQGFEIDLAAHPHRCAAFWIQELKANEPQVLYADHNVSSIKEKNGPS